MLISLVVGFVFLLAAFTFFQFLRDSLSPAVVFPFVWGVTIFGIGFGELFGYLQISPGAFLIFIFGAFSFVIGALFGAKKSISCHKILACELDYRKIIWFCFALHAIMLPLSLVEVSQITGGIDDVFAAAYFLRAASVSGEEKVGAVVGNYLLVGLFFVPVLMIGWMQKRVWFSILLILAAPWVLLNIFIGGRSGLIMLIFSLIYVYVSISDGFKLRVIALFGICFIFVLVVGNLLVSKIDARFEDGLGLIFQQSAKSFFDYLLQGPILFSEYFNNQNLINPTWDALIFPCHILEKFNFCKVLPLHQEYMIFSQSGDSGNVYSLFFSIYPKYGWLGVIIISFVYGFWASFHHSRRFQLLVHLLVGGFLFAAILLSIFSDAFGQNIYFFIKISIISSVVSFVFKKSKNSSIDAGG